MKRLATLATLVLVAAMPFYATQSPRRAATGSENSCSQCPPPPAVVASFLGLSEVQTAQFIQTLGQLEGILGALQQQIAMLQHQLDPLLSQPNPNPAAIVQTTLQIHALQQQVAHAVQSYHGQIAGLLTMDQKQKIQEVALASQLQPVVGAFVSLYLAPPPTPLPCPGQ
jgi:hypothetical protein